MEKIAEILGSKSKPKEKQNRLVAAVLSGEIPAGDLIAFFETANNTDKGACADAFKHISGRNPELLAPYIDLLIRYINHPLPRVKWGVPETIGILTRFFPRQTARAIPSLFKNTTDNRSSIDASILDAVNTTVIRWCAAYALGEIAKFHPASREQLLPIFEQLIQSEQNNGVRKVYVKALKAIQE